MSIQGFGASIVALIEGADVVGWANKDASDVWDAAVRCANEERQNPRGGTCCPAVVVLEGRTVPCVVYNFWSTGARIRLLSSANLTPEFEVQFSRVRAVSRPCRLISRIGPQVDIEFISPRLGAEQFLDM